MTKVNFYVYPTLKTVWRWEPRTSVLVPSFIVQIWFQSIEPMVDIPFDAACLLSLVGACEPRSDVDVIETWAGTAAERADEVTHR